MSAVPLYRHLFFLLNDAFVDKRGWGKLVRRRQVFDLLELI